MARVTLEKVAQETGLSVSTVSRALRGHSNVSQDTQQQVQRAYERLLYAGAEKPSSTRRSVLGFLMPTSKISLAIQDNIPKEFQSMQEAALEYGCSLMMGSYGTDGVGDQMIQQRTVDGAIVYGVLIDDPIYQKLQQFKIPFIVLHRLLRQSGYHYVGVDDRAGACRGVEHLISRGHREIAFLSGPANVLPITEKLAGYTETLQKHNIAIRPPWILHSPRGATEAQGLELGLHLLESTARPQAVFAATDRIALGVLEAAEQKGIDVPGDLAVVGFDNLKKSSSSHPPLTTVAVPWAQMMYLSVSLLVQLIEHGAAVEQIEAKLKTELIVRRST